MSRLTVLDMTQGILSAMDSDEVNSIADTTESLQVAEVVRETYLELVANRTIPELQGLVKLDSLNDTLQPFVMKIPDNVSEIKWIKYDVSEDGDGSYKDIWKLEPEDFIERTMLSGGALRTHSGGSLRILNNKDPDWWTTFDDQNIVFDSYNSDLDSTLQESKSLAFCSFQRAFQMTDDFIPPLDDNLFPLLLAEAKRACFLYFKDSDSPMDAQRARRQRRMVQSKLWRADQRDYNGPNYGRPRPYLRKWHQRYPKY